MSELRRIGHRQNLGPLDRRQLVGWLVLPQRALVATDRPALLPALHSAWTESQYSTGRCLPGARRHRLCQEFELLVALFEESHSTSPPKSARYFF